jgi:hypothetical protein
MSRMLNLLEYLSSIFCRHEWVRDRREDGELALRCMKCMKRKEHDLLRLIRWRPDYTPIEPSRPSEFPEPLQPATGEAERHPGKLLWARAAEKARTKASRSAA